MISSLELARLCGVSQGTVDRALHQRSGISPQTRERILRLAQKHGYRPNPAARELITGQSGIVGAIVPSMNNVFFMDLFNALGKRLKERNLRMQLTPVESQEDFLGALDEFASRRHRMALVIPPEEGIAIPRSITECLPVISMVSPCKGEGVHFIAPDEYKMGRYAVQYLFARGHRRILHLTYARQRYAVKARADGYWEQSLEMNLQPQILAGINRENLSEAIKAAKPTALFCHNDWLALTTMLLLSELGIRVPEDISVLGVDNSPTLMAINPHLTTIAYPIEEVGQAVFQIMDKKTVSMSTGEFQVAERETVRNIY